MEADVEWILSTGFRIQDWACLVISSGHQKGAENCNDSDLHTGEFALCPRAQRVISLNIMCALLVSAV